LLGADEGCREALTKEIDFTAPIKLQSKELILNTWEFDPQVIEKLENN
jgi:hypothetical protein